LKLGKIGGEVGGRIARPDPDVIFAVGHVDTRANHVNLVSEANIHDFFWCLGIVRAQEIEPAGRRVKRFVEKSWFCWHLTKSAVHPTRSRGRLEWRAGV